MASNVPQITMDIPSFDLARLMQRRKLLAGAALGILGAVCLIALAWQVIPRTLAARERMAESERTVSTTAQRAAIITNISTADRENFIRVAQALPQTKEPLIVLQAIEDIARESNVVVGKFDTTPGLVSTASAVVNRAAARTTAQNLTIAVEISGSFNEINRALELLENAAPIMEVTELGLTPTDRSATSTTSSRYTATLQITTYFLPPQSPTAGRTAQPLTAPQNQTLQALLTWRNRLPAVVDSPEVFLRTNLFIIEGIGGGLSLPGQTQPTAIPEPDGSSQPSSEVILLPESSDTSSSTPAPTPTADPTLQQVPVTAEDFADDE